MDTRRKHNRHSSLHASDSEVQQDLQLLYHCSAQQAQSLLQSPMAPTRTKRRRTVSTRKIEDLDGVLGFASFLSENEGVKEPGKRLCKWEVPQAWEKALEDWSQSIGAGERKSACRHVAIAAFIKKDLTAELISSH